MATHTVRGPNHCSAEAYFSTEGVPAVAIAVCSVASMTAKGNECLQVRKRSWSCSKCVYGKYSADTNMVRDTPAVTSDMPA